MTYSPLLIFHIAGGVVAIISGFVALFVRKGSRLHRRSGVVFAISMFVMAAGGGYVALVKSQPSNVLAALFTFYLITTAWLTVKRKQKAPDKVDAALTLMAIATGIGALVLGATAHKGAVMYYVFAVLLFLCAIGDIRVFIRGGFAGAQRLARHLWRMCFALFVAAGSFFLGTASDPVLRKTGLRATLFTKAVRQTHLPEVPVLIIFVLMIFWLVRIRFGNTYKKAEPAPQ